MTLNDFEVQGLADAIAAWCDYQVHCGRDTLLSERYLAQPIAEYLGSRFSSRNIYAEWNMHDAQDEAGRPRQLDFVVKQPDRARPSMAIETKWVNNLSTPQKKAVVNDIMRLWAYPLLHQYPRNSQPQLLFILAGRKDAMKRARNAKIRIGNGAQAPFLSAVLSNALLDPKEIMLNQLSDRLTSMYKAFEDRYCIELPQMYHANLLGRRSLKTVQVMIWAVSRGNV